MEISGSKYHIIPRLLNLRVIVQQVAERTTVAMVSKQKYMRIEV